MPSSRPLSTQPRVIAALVTPFTGAGEFDPASLQRLVAHIQRGGVEEFFAVASTGESPLLDDADRLAIIETVRQAAPAGRVWAGVSGTGHRHALRNARAAARAGADVAVLMAPFFVRLDQDQLAAYCLAVAEASPIPVAVYHHLRMPTAFAVPTVARLAAHENIVAIKDTNGGDHDRCAEILAATAGQSFLFLQGVEKLVLSTLQAGGHGCVVAQGCLAPHYFHQLVAAWQAGDRVRAREIQGRIDALWGIFLQPEVKQSFGHFLHTLKLPLFQQGVLATTAGALPAGHFDPAFERKITDFMREHLQGTVPTGAAAPC